MFYINRNVWMKNILQCFLDKSNIQPILSWYVLDCNFLNDILQYTNTPHWKCYEFKLTDDKISRQCSPVNKWMEGKNFWILSDIVIYLILFNDCIQLRKILTVLYTWVTFKKYYWCVFSLLLFYLISWNYIIINTIA